MEEPTPSSTADIFADPEVLGTKKTTSEDVDVAEDADDDSSAVSDSSSSSGSVSSSSSGSSSTSCTSSSRNNITPHEEKKEQERQQPPPVETKTEPLVPLDVDVDTEEEKEQQPSSQQEGGAGAETLQKLHERVSISKQKLFDQQTLAQDRLREQESKTGEKEEDVLYWKKKYEDSVAAAVAAAAKHKTDNANDNDNEAQAASWERKLEEAQTEWKARRDREEKHRTEAAIDEGLSAASEQLEQILGEAEREIQALTNTNKELKADAVLYVKLKRKHDELESLLQSKDIEVGKLQDALREKTEEAARALKDHQADLVQAKSQAPQEATDSNSGSNSNGPEQDNKVAADLFRQNAELQEQNKELRTEQEKKTKALESKIKEVKDRAMTRLRQISLLERKLMESAKESKLLWAKVKKLEDHCLAVKKESKERRRDSHKVKRDLQKALKRIKELLSLQAEQGVAAAAAAPANANANARVRTVDAEEKSTGTENKNLTISVLTWTGDLIEIKDITNDTSIDEIKEKIAEEKSIDEDRQTLVNKAGTELSDDWRTLRGYGIRDGDTLMLDNPQKKSLKINVLTWSGDFLEIDDISTTMSMDKIQEKIAARTSVSIDRQTLLLKGGAKVSNRSLRSIGSLRSLGSSMNFSNHSQSSQKSVRSLGLYGIQNGDTIMLDNPEKEILKIDVITWTGDLVNLRDISTETLVEEMKDKIAAETSASKDEQILKKGTTELYYNQRSLGAYGIQSGDTLMLDIPENKKMPVVAERPSPKDVTITVLTWTGDMVEIEDISNDVSIEVIKDKIAAETAVSKDEQLLMKGPTELSDNQKSLGDYGIQDDATLMLANPEKKSAADAKPSTPEIANITINVLTWTGNLVEILDVTSETFVDQFKDKIAVETSVSKDKQTLMKGSTELYYDRRSLGGYGIKDGDTLMLDNPEKKVTSNGGFWGWGK